MTHAEPSGTFAGAVCPSSAPMFVDAACRGSRVPRGEPFRPRGDLRALDGLGPSGCPPRPARRCRPRRLLPARPRVRVGPGRPHPDVVARRARPRARRSSRAGPAVRRVRVERERGAWQYHLTGTSAPRPAFVVELVAACRERGVPTVFWNKEDPAHFEDFLDAAALFDHVYTTDVGRVDAYRERLGHDRVGSWRSGRSPRSTTPRARTATGPRATSRSAACTSRTSTRSVGRRWTCCSARPSTSRRACSTVSRSSPGSGAGTRYQFPEPFGSRVVGSLDYDRMLTAYREYKVFLNVSSVVDSPSMCARRVFEITACGTPVVTTPSAAVGEFFPPDEVFVVGERAEAAHTIRALVRSRELRDRATHRGSGGSGASTRTGRGSSACCTTSGWPARRRSLARASLPWSRPTARASWTTCCEPWARSATSTCSSRSSRTGSPCTRRTCGCAPRRPASRTSCSARPVTTCRWGVPQPPRRRVRR